MQRQIYVHLHLISFFVLDCEFAPKIKLYFSQYVERYLPKSD